MKSKPQHRQETQRRKALPVWALAAIAATIAVAKPTDAFAQCETPGSTMGIATGTVIPAQAAAITAMQTTLSALYTATTTASSAALIASLEAMETALNQRMRRFWRDWEEALKAMTTQLNAGVTDQARQMSSLFDSSNLTETARGFQRREFEARQNFRPTDEGCRFDTVAVPLTKASGTTRAATNMLAQTTSQLANNNAGTPAANGPAGVVRTRFEEYRNRFCDHLANGGNTACGGSSATTPNAHLMPSVTLFGRETLDMTNPDIAIAVNELIYNITGFEPPETIENSVLNGAAGKEQRQHNRSYLAQMDAVNALGFSIVAERAPTNADGSDQVREIRQRVGINDASANPSEREIRQSIMEQLWDPGYYVGLTDGATSVSQKEVFLQAYNLMLLYRMFEKAEKIATAQAIEAGNILDRKATSLRGGGRNELPTNQ